MTANKGISFDHLFMGDNRHPQTLHDSLTAYAAAGEIFQTHLAYLVDEQWVDLDNWLPSGGSYAVGSYQDSGATIDAAPGVQVSGGSAPGLLLSTDTNSGDRAGMLKTRVLDPNTGFLIAFRSEDSSNFYFANYWGGKINFGRMLASGDYETNHEILNSVVFPIDVPFADMELYWRELRYSTIDNEFWLLATLVISGKPVLSMYAPIDKDNPPGLRYGPGAGAPYGYATYTLFRAVDLGEIDDWSAIDPGSSPLEPISSILEGRNIRLQERFDGSLRAWKPRAAVSVWTLPDDDEYSYARNFDPTKIITHFRQVGAYDQAEYTDEIANRKYGHKFGQGNNPYLMTPEECYVGAQRTINQALEAADTIQISGPYIPMLENEDVIDTPHGVYIIDNIQVGVEGARHIMQVSGRKYIYGA